MERNQRKLLISLLWAVLVSGLAFLLFWLTTGAPPAEILPGSLFLLAVLLIREYVLWRRSRPEPGADAKSSSMHS